MKVVAFNPSVSRGGVKADTQGRTPPKFTLDPEEFRVIAKALGADHGGLPDRNYFVVKSGSTDGQVLPRLVRAGLMAFAAGPMWKGQYVYTVTEAGRSAVGRYLLALA